MPFPSSGLTVEGRRPKQLEWSFRAARDVLAIDMYLSAENPNAAFEVVEHIVKRAEQLRRHPFLGHSLGSGRPRKLVLTRYPYNIHYRLTASRVRILRVLHQARRLP
jgi:toxin ParE1/3/4